MDRIGSVPTAKKERINDNYELEEITPETLKIMGHKESDSDAAKQAKIKVKFKIILKDNCVSLLGMGRSRKSNPNTGMEGNQH